MMNDKLIRCAYTKTNALDFHAYPSNIGPLICLHRFIIELYITA